MHRFYQSDEPKTSVNDLKGHFSNLLPNDTVWCDTMRSPSCLLDRTYKTDVFFPSYPLENVDAMYFTVVGPRIEPDGKPLKRYRPVMFAGKYPAHV